MTKVEAMAWSKDNNGKNKGHAGHKPGRPPFRPKKLKTSLPRPAQAEAPLAERKSAERIAKVIARAGLCSRREAEEWIVAGRVSVNGAVIPSPALNVKSTDAITVDGKPLPQRERTRLFLYYKPRGLVTTNSDPEGRPTIFGALPKSLPRLITVGRLDLNTEGLLLLTNDGGLARVLELPETGWLRRYRVRALGRIDQPTLDGLRNGIEIEGVRYGAIEATLDREQGANVWLTFSIREGKNREVRNVLEHLGLKVNRLIRLSFGPFQLGELKETAVEEVKTRTLREQLGEHIVAQAGVDFEGPISLGLPVQSVKDTSTRHPEARAQRASKGNGPGRSSFEGRLRRPPQDDGKEHDKPKRVRREDVIADRRGRQIPVTRTHTEKTERPPPPPKRGKPPRRDRTRGPRPGRPR
jgi:23S rRNA pseudouridine2605 synthase